jgi:hypothetical protein
MGERVINFDDLHMNILLSRFSIGLPPTFHKPIESKDKENIPNKGKGGGEEENKEKNAKVKMERGEAERRRATG